MTEQDELFNGDKEQSAPTKQTERPGPQAAPGRRDIAGGGIAGGEVRAVAPPVRRTPSNLPLLLLILVVLLLGGGYLLISRESPPVQMAASPQKQPIPVRPALDPQVEEQRVDQHQVAAVQSQQDVAPAADPEPEISAISEREKLPVTAAEKPAAETAPAEKVSEPSVAAAPAVVTEPEAAAGPVDLYTVMVGPFVSKSTLAAGTEQLRELGFEPAQTSGRGLVEMTRLLVGRYPAAEASTRLAALKKQVKSAFMLPDGELRAIYAGSFHDAERAEKLRSELTDSGIELTPVVGQVEMNGKMLIALQADQQTAREVAERIGKTGLQTHVLRK